MKTKASTKKSSPADAVLSASSLLTVKSILVPIDFSTHSESALLYAARFAGQFGAKLTLLHVIQPIFAPEAVAVLAMEKDGAAKAARKQLEATRTKLGVAPRLVERLLVRIGAPFHEISEAAKSLKVDLVVIATHGHTGLKHVLLGSTAERVVRHAPCPVLVVRLRGQN